MTNSAFIVTAAMRFWMLSGLLALVASGCRKGVEVAAEATTQAAFELLRTEACEDKVEAVLSRLDAQKIRKNEQSRVAARGGDVATLVFVVAAQVLADIGKGDLSLFCGAKDIQVDERAQRVTWLTRDNKRMFATFERSGGEYTVVDLGVVES